MLRKGNHCYYADEDAIAPLWKGRQFPIETCISGWAMLNRQHVVIPDIYSDDRIPHDAYRPTFVKSLMMVPVRREDPIAAIGAYWATYHVATPVEIGVLQSLADAAALALYNVQLDANLKAALRQEREARESAESASRLKDEFLALLSHELRTPLHVINNWLWQLKQGKTISPTDPVEGARRHRTQHGAAVAPGRRSAGRVARGRGQDVHRLAARAARRIVRVGRGAESAGGEGKIHHIDADRRKMTRASGVIRTGCSRCSTTWCRTPSSFRRKAAASTCRWRATARWPAWW